MTKKTKNNRAFIGIFWVAIVMFITTVIMMTATYSFTNFVATPPSLLMKPFQAYYNAELGIWYGKKLLDQSPSATNPPDFVPVNSGQTVTVALAETLEPVNPPNHSITSTALANSTLPQRTVTAHYKTADKIIDSF